MRASIHAHQLDGAAVTVMGLGRFGGGAGATRWLLEHGARVTLTDLRDENELAEALTALDGLDTSRLSLRLGRHQEGDFDHADAVVVNPAVPRPWENRYVRVAHEAGAVVTTEIRLAIEHLPKEAFTIGITGSTGKSTTASMLHHALRAAWSGGRAHLAGNIGGALLDTLADINAGDALVLELSSAQLWWLSQQPAWTPDIALVTNLVPNHLDWHGTMEHYASSKRAIVGARLCCHEGPIQQWGEGAEVRTVPATRAQTLLDSGEMMLPGSHNAQNAALAERGALWALECAGVLGGEHAREVRRAVVSFEGLAHRLRTLGTARDVRIVDDSKCTTPEGVALALDAFADRRVHLICGGVDKGVNLTPLVERATSCASVLCIGATGERLAADINAGGGRAEVCVTLDRACDRAAVLVHEGDVLLLSPGCASWDQFPHYIARAGAFRDGVVRALGPISG